MGTSAYYLSSGEDGSKRVLLSSPTHPVNSQWLPPAGVPRGRGWSNIPSHLSQPFLELHPMKITLQFKTPDVLEDLIADAISISALRKGQMDRGEIDEDFVETDPKEIVEELKDQLSKWIEYGESVQLEYDTDTQTIKVLEA